MGTDHLKTRGWQASHQLRGQHYNPRTGALTGGHKKYGRTASFGMLLGGMLGLADLAAAPWHLVPPVAVQTTLVLVALMAALLVVIMSLQPTPTPSPVIE